MCLQRSAGRAHITAPQRGASVRRPLPLKRRLGHVPIAKRLSSLDGLAVRKQIDNAIPRVILTPYSGCTDA